MGACLPGALVIFLIGSTSSPLGPAPAAAPFGDTGVFLGLGLGLGLGRAGGGGAGAADVSEWFSVFSINEKVNRSRLIQTHTVEGAGERHTVTLIQNVLSPWETVVFCTRESKLWGRKDQKYKG